MIFEFYARPWENAVDPTIVLDNPSGGDPHILATLRRIHRPDDLYELCRRANLHDALRAEVERLREMLRNLAEAPALSGVRGMVAGWNGEDRPEGRYAERHPAQLGANIRTTCGRVYSLDEAMEAARAALKGGEG